MIVPFLRSSLITTSRLCEGRVFIEYGIGRRSSDSDATTKGSVIHQVLELMAVEKLNRQNGLSEQEIDPYGILEEVYQKFDDGKPGVLKDGSYKECIGLLKKALEFQNGIYNPLNQNVLAVEYSFDIEIKEDWAAYKHEIPDGVLAGNLRLKGTCDLICEEDEQTIHIIDYKTSKTTKDWATDKEKTSENIKEDPQLKFYFYALAHEFPQYENIMMTLYFVRLGKPLTAIFDRSDLPDIENWIKKGYKKLQSIEQPKWIDRTKTKWKCRFCAFSKDIEPGSNQTVCKFFQSKLKKDGFQKTMADKADYSIITSYGSGGGKEFKE